MDYTIEDRLKRLKSRRFDDANAALKSGGYMEDFERRTNNQATRYALGAMQQVDHRSTEISLEEAQKVEAALQQRLPKHRLSPAFRLQGSVTMNTHIKGVSDVDLLEIHGTYLKYSTSGIRTSIYSGIEDTRTVEDHVLHMRKVTEDELKLQYYGAKVDTSKDKSIALSEGSFRRKVDVVPSYWFDSDSYQGTADETYRGVGIVNRRTRQSTTNFPFLFKERVNQKGRETNQGSKMAIRLLKNLSADSEMELSISSYDIASLFYYCPSHLITNAVARELSVLSGAAEFVMDLANDPVYTKGLKAPDGTRRIFDTTEKWPDFLRLSENTRKLAGEVERELVGSPPYFDRDLGEVLRHLKEHQIPMVPS